MTKRKYLISKIREILVSSEECRDNLLFTIQLVHNSELEINSLTKEQYYDILFAGKLSSVHTIKRLWQLIQEKNIELRGKNWVKRQIQSGNMAKEFATLSNEDYLDALFHPSLKQLKLF